jgi:hypothetical protein
LTEQGNGALQIQVIIAKAMIPAARFLKSPSIPLIHCRCSRTWAISSVRLNTKRPKTIRLDLRQLGRGFSRALGGAEIICLALCLFPKT